MAMPQTATSGTQRSLFVITGASRGFGRALAIALAESPLVTSQPTDMVLTARTVAVLAETKRAVEKVHDDADAMVRHALSVHVVACNFSSADKTDESIAALVALPAWDVGYANVTLINNAGSLGTLARLRDLRAAADVRESIEANLTAPLLLTSTFLRRFASVCGRCVVVNVSSLAGVQPFDTWGVYSSVKAARDMFHRTVALEEAMVEVQEAFPGAGSDDSEAIGGSARGTRVRVLNYAPGPMDTGMQTKIRSEMPDVPLRRVYARMHEQGRLVDPHQSAKALLTLIESDEFDNGSHIDFYDIQTESP